MFFGRIRSHWLLLVLVLVNAALSAPARAQTNAQFEKLRAALVEDVIIGSGIKDKRVVDAIRNTERHKFVAVKYRANAYYDMALPIGDQQTISSPFIVALMTESLEPQATDKVLEIGTGSGYQAAVLSPLVKEVYSIEIVAPLGKKAAKTLEELGYKNVFTKVGDGYKGWPDKAPFDKIIVTCSPEKVPQPLVDQLAEGGRMVVPVGERYQQTLYLFRKKNGKLESEALRPTLFVPMTGAAEAARQVKPDPQHPRVINGSFEDVAESDDKNYVPGWYYHRLTTWEEDASAPDGKHCISFENDISGRASHLLQGFPIDGAHIAELQMSAFVKTKDVAAGKETTEIPVVAITFYDDQRRDLGTSWMGPYKGTQDWHESKKTFRVPAAAKEGILRLGLFGATGKVSYDSVEMTPIVRGGGAPKPLKTFKIEDK
jgi:protein-L-isoaspartate(D-aspartate) O-methyltransferase